MRQARLRDQRANHIVSRWTLGVVTALITLWAAFLVLAGEGPTDYFAGPPAQSAIPESWLVPLYWAGWVAIGLGLLGAVLAWRGRFGLVAGVLLLTTIGVVASLIGILERQPPMVMLIGFWIPILLGYPACTAMAIYAALYRPVAVQPRAGPWPADSSDHG